VRELLGAGEPVGVMFMNLLHCLWDREDPWGIVGRFREIAPPGSYLALSHMTSETHPDAAEGLFRMTRQLHWNTPLISRDQASIARFFEGFTLVEPGLVAPAQWRPERDWLPLSVGSLWARSWPPASPMATATSLCSRA
jgi:hypothetical protein